MHENSHIYMYKEPLAPYSFIYICVCARVHIYTEDNLMMSRYACMRQQSKMHFNVKVQEMGLTKSQPAVHQSIDTHSLYAEFPKRTHLFFRRFLCVTKSAAQRTFRLLNTIYMYAMCTHSLCANMQRAFSYKTHAPVRLLFLYTIYTSPRAAQVNILISTYSQTESSCVSSLQCDKIIERARLTFAPKC